MEKENRLTYVDDEGNEVLCEVLFTFTSDEFKKNYVLFYPVGMENDEDVEVMAASFVEDGDGSVGELTEIETEAEWDLVEEMLASFVEEDDEECHCNCEDCDECNEDECCEDHCGCHHKH